jgi:hypothetical protein
MGINPPPCSGQQEKKMMWSLLPVCPHFTSGSSFLTIVTNRSLELVIEFGKTVHLFADTTYVDDGVVSKFYGGEGEGHAVGSEEVKDLIVWLKQAVAS